MAEPAEKDQPAPPREQRMKWWWQACLFGFGLPALLPPLVAFVMAFVSGGGILVSLFLLIVIPIEVFLFPLGLAADFSFLVSACWDREWPANYETADAVVFYFSPVGYGLFGLHWYLTRTITTERDFKLLKLSLILLIIGSLIGLLHLFGPIT